MKPTISTLAKSSRRHVLCAPLPAAIAAAVISTACAWPPGQPSQKKAVRVALPGGAPAYDDVSAAIERAAASANGASGSPFAIKTERVPFPDRAVGSPPLAQVMARLLAGDQAADVVLAVSRAGDNSLPAGEVAELVARQQLAPLDDLAKNDRAYQSNAFCPAALDALRHQGKTYARPLTVEPLMLYYDPALLDAGGVRPPDAAWDWTIFRDSARRLTRESGGQPEQWGCFSIPPLWYLVNLIWQNGGDVVAPDMRTPQIAERPAVEAMEYLHDLIAVRRVAPPPPALGTASPYALRFQGGRIFAGPTQVAMALGPGAIDLRQVLFDLGFPDVQALGVTEPAQGKQRATGLRVVASLGLTAAARDLPTAYEALALLERNASSQLPLTARRPTADHIRRVAPSLNPTTATSLANAIGYGRVVRLGSMLSTQRVVAALWQTAISGMFGGGLTPGAAAAATARQLEGLLVS